jgi:hypothetical protein
MLAMGADLFLVNRQPDQTKEIIGIQIDLREHWEVVHHSFALLGPSGENCTWLEKRCVDLGDKVNQKAESKLRITKHTGVVVTLSGLI